jgi:homocitrate synthase NifV
MGEDERDAIRAVADLGLRSQLMVWSRILAEDAARGRGLDVDLVDLSLPVSDQQLSRKLGKDRGWSLAQTRRVVPVAQDLGLAVCVGAEDAWRSTSAPSAVPGSRRTCR